MKKAILLGAFILTADLTFSQGNEGIIQTVRDAYNELNTPAPKSEPREEIRVGEERENEAAEKKMYQNIQDNADWNRQKDEEEAAERAKKRSQEPDKQLKY